MAGAAALLFAAVDVSAQEAPYISQEVKAPSNAFEIAIATGYTQGFGEVQKGSDVIDLAGAGMGFDLGLGYRLNPRWMIGVSGAYQAYQGGNTSGDTSAGGGSAHIEAAYHFSPYSRLDPWLRAATGYRYLCECGTSGREGAQMHGFDLLGVNGGLDLRVDRHVALAPLVGATLTTFLWDHTTAVADPRPSVFGFAGLQARFDLGGSYAEAGPTVAAR